jgi:hypothetical protein
MQFARAMGNGLLGLMKRIALGGKTWDGSAGEGESTARRPIGGEECNVGKPSLRGAMQCKQGSLGRVVQRRQGYIVLE